jgi:hypothetical protein
LLPVLASQLPIVKQLIQYPVGPSMYFCFSRTSFECLLEHRFKHLMIWLTINLNDNCTVIAPPNAENMSTVDDAVFQGHPET